MPKAALCDYLQASAIVNVFLPPGAFEATPMAASPGAAAAAVPAARPSPGTAAVSALLTASLS